MKALIVDDEPLARQRLRHLLGEEPDVEVVGECRNGAEARAAIAASPPDLLFLDVQMPEADGFAVLRALPPGAPTAVVFVTAHRDFAVEAFAADALDYLLKPFDQERFRQALGRARARVKSGVPRPAPSYADRLVVKSGWRLKLVRVADVDYALAEGNYVAVHVGAKSHLVRETLTALEQRLDPREFVRVHRSALVRIDRVEEVEPLAAGELVLILRDGTRLTSGRSYRARLQEALQLG